MVIEGSPEAEGRSSIMRMLNRDPFDVWTRDSFGERHRSVIGIGGAGAVRSGRARHGPPAARPR